MDRCLLRLKMFCGDEKRREKKQYQFASPLWQSQKVCFCRREVSRVLLLAASRNSKGFKTQTALPHVDKREQDGGSADPDT